MLTTYPLHIWRKISAVSAEMSTFVPRREVYDNAYLTTRYHSGARGRIWGSYIAAGNDHGLCFRIYGELGGLQWHQEDPEVLWFKPIGGQAQRIARGYQNLSPWATRGSRFRPGHPSTLWRCQSLCGFRLCCEACQLVCHMNSSTSATNHQ